MKKIRVGRRVLLFMMSLMMACMAVGCGSNENPGSSGTSTPEQGTPSASMTPVPMTPPPALTPQPAAEDSGIPVTYTVSGTISSSMVVQRNQYFNVFGWSEDVGGVLYGEFMGEKRYAVVDESGTWCIQFSSHEATKDEQTLKIYPQNGKTTEFRGILVGDVWVVSGQSNAELSMTYALQKDPDYAQEVNRNDDIRLFIQNKTGVDSIKNTLDLSKPQENTIVSSWKWTKTTDNAVRQFSAVGYYFAKELSKVVDVPIGVVAAAAGGAVLHELMPGNVAAEFGFTSAPTVPVSGYYNALLHPFTKNPIAGMIFYQGESETGGGKYQVYAQQLQRTVEEYRSIWGYMFPFINVQLSTHMEKAPTMWPQLPEIRAAQFDAYKNIPYSYIVTSMDQGFREGDADWAHPYYKKEVGIRVAAIAAAAVYEKADMNSSLCPEPNTVTWDGKSVVIDYQYVGDGLKLLTGNTVLGFTAYNAGGDTVSCTAELLDGDTIKITASEELSAIGYGMFQDGYPEKANVASSVGFPSPAFKINK